ncbi:hypothetical protein B14911_17165 [Bacillus sp. NRRL B-14911]|nr:hypothetical protein B14911_17165 [Bacillus sp. NRRL B-14911]
MVIINSEDALWGAFFFWVWRGISEAAEAVVERELLIKRESC